MEPTSTHPGATIVDAFLAVIRPNKSRTGRVTENDDFIKMLMRQIRALEARAIEDLAIIAQVELVRQRLAEVTAVAIAANAARYAVDPHSGGSAAEAARILNASKQAASQRRAIGNRIMNERIEAAGAVDFAEARRERDAVKRAAEYAREQIGAARVVQLDAYRARHRAA